DSKHTAKHANQGKTVDPRRQVPGTAFARSEVSTTGCQLSSLVRLASPRKESRPMPDHNARDILEAVYVRLREKLSAKELSPERVKKAALAALDEAKAKIELDPNWLSTEIERLHHKSHDRGPRTED